MILEYAPSSIQRRAAALALAFAPMLVAGLVATNFVLARAAHHERLSRLLAERQADLALLHDAPMWKNEIARLRQAGSGAALFFADPEVSAAGSQMQARVTSIVTAGGGTVQRSNVDLVAAGDEAPVELRTTVTFAADIAAFTHILYHLRQARPLLFVAKLAMREAAGSTSRGTTPVAPNLLQIDLTMVGYRPGQ